MSIFLNGIEAKYITLQAGASLSEGLPCAISENCTARDADIDEAFLGVTNSVQDDLASVQVAGYVKLRYSGTISAPGFYSLCANGMGGVKVATEGGREHLVVEVDTKRKTVGLFL